MKSTKSDDLTLLTNDDDISVETLAETHKSVLGIGAEMAEDCTVEDTREQVLTTEDDDGVFSEEVDENGNRGYLEDLDLGDTSVFSTEERNQLFQQGLDLEMDKQTSQALQCYLGCIRGLQQNSSFVLLPQCLHSIANIYRGQGNYESAIHFAQAEKLFYENALIETKGIQEKLEEISASESSNLSKDLNELNINSMRAEEYEHLAKLCLDKQQPQLALEYAGKCTKLRQEIFGDNHEKTRSSLDLFASVYAEVGKLEYSDSIELLSKEPPVEMSETPVVPEVVMSLSEENPKPILRQRSEKTETPPEKLSDQEKKHVRFHESVEESIRARETEEFASMTITLVVLAVLFLILASMGMWLYCSVTRSDTCVTLTSHLHTWLRQIQYNIHSLTKTS